MNAMDTMFENNALDMIALESAMSLFEVENDITPAYLASDYSRDAAAGYVSATEGAFGDDDFFASLFNDAPVVAAATEGSGESLGARIGNTIKKIIGAIKGFFANLASKFKTKSETVAETVEKAKTITLSDIEKQIYADAKDVRAAASKLVAILNTSYKTECAQIKKICQCVEKSVKAARKGGANFRTIGEGDNEKTRTEKMDANRAGAIKYAEHFSDNMGGTNDIDTNNEKTNAELNIAEQALEHMRKLADDVDAAYKVVQERFTSFMKTSKSNIRKYNDENDDDSDLPSMPDSSKKDDHAGNAQKEFDRRRAAETSKPASDVTANINKILYKAFYANETNLIQSMNNTVKDVIKVCTDQTTACDVIMSATDAIKDDGTYAKIAYRSCKIYKESSVVFNKLSSRLNDCITCGFFRTTSNKKDAEDNDKEINDIK